MATPAKDTIMTPRRRRRGPGRAGPGRVPGPDLDPGNAGPPRLAAPAAAVSQEWLPPGWFIAAVYWDVESGGLDLEARSRGEAYRQFTDAGIPRDGGMADLLAEAASPVPKFAAVICEDIERSGRDTFNALKLEKKLSRNGIPLFATDEPAHIDGVNATTVLVRRMKQGVAEWFRLQLKEKTWKGLVEHSLDGWNIGTAPYGYLADRIPHRPGQGQPGPHQDPPGPGPRPRPGRGADLHLAGRGQARHADHRGPAQRPPGPLPRPAAAAGPPRA